MIRPKSKIFLANPFLTALLLLPILSIGQETDNYIGALKIGPYQGEAEYGYKIIDNDTLFDGTFQMRRSNLQALLEKEDSSFSFTGSFKDNYPEGYWQFQFGEFQSQSKTEVIDFQYRVKVSGVQEEASGLIEKGKPEGPWTYSVNRIKDSEVEKKLFRSSIVFENGIPQRNFRIENDSSTLVGRFLRNGLAHDEWSLYGLNELSDEEGWIFNDGILKTIKRQENGVSQSISVFNNNQVKTNVINLDSRYLNVLKLYQPSKDSINLFSGGIPDLLEENAKYYQKIDTILSKLGESSFLPEFKVKVPYFPLDSLELVQVDSIKSNFIKSKKISEGFLNDTQLNILKLSDEESLYLFSVVSDISKNFLVPLEKMTRYEEQDIIEFISQKKLFQNLWPRGVPSKERILEMKIDTVSITKTYQLQNSDAFVFEGNNIGTIEQISKFAQAALNSIDKVLGEKLTSEKRQKELISLEEKLIVQNKELQQLIDSSQTALPSSYKKALNHIKEVSDKNLSDFSIQEELTSARRLVACHKQMNTLAKAVADLPIQSKEIAAKYNDRVWNPFMATLMDEEVKKRITTAYRKVLVPYFINKIQSDLSCENAQELALGMENVFRRMLELRNEDTSKIERKLRKEEGPKVVLQLFNTIPETKEN